MRIGSVVLHYRFWPGVRSTLTSLANQSRQLDEILVVDNSSGDGSADKIREEFPDLSVIEAPYNGGYASGMNIGIGRLLGQGMDGILLLTHECELSSNALEILTGRMESEPSVAAVGPLLGFLSSREQVYSAGGFLDPVTWETNQIRSPDRIDEWRDRPPHPVAWLDGAAILLRSRSLRQAGPLSTAYFMYFEESEYLLRLPRMGWRVECVPAAVGWQEPAWESFPLAFRIRNRLRFLARNAPKRVLARELSYLLVNGLKRTIRQPRSFRRVLGPRLIGISDFALGRVGPPETFVDRKGSETSYRASKAAIPGRGDR
jgi:GT2 family glycosyltransferase